MIMYQDHKRRKENKEMKWLEKEDEIVVKFYLNHVNDWQNHMDEIMNEFRSSGLTDHNEGSIRMRIQNVSYIHTGVGLCHPASQTIRIYNKNK